VPPWASAHGWAEQAEARSSTVNRAPHRGASILAQNISLLFCF
jgi:hypothetical protein